MRTALHHHVPPDPCLHKGQLRETERTKLLARAESTGSCTNCNTGNRKLALADKLMRLETAVVVLLPCGGCRAKRPANSLPDALLRRRFNYRPSWSPRRRQGYTFYVLDMASQKWLAINDTDRPVLEALAHHRAADHVATPPF